MTLHVVDDEFDWIGVLKDNFRGVRFHAFLVLFDRGTNNGRDPCAEVLGIVFAKGDHEAFRDWNGFNGEKFRVEVAG